MEFKLITPPPVERQVQITMTVKEFWHLRELLSSSIQQIGSYTTRCMFEKFDEAYRHKIGGPIS